MTEPEDKNTKSFKPLGEYAWPDMPAERTVLSLLDRVKDMVGINDQEPEINTDRLHRTTKKRRDDVTSQPACGPLVSEIDTAITTWLSEHESKPSICLLVLPPCQQQNLITEWARLNGKEVLKPPKRDTLLESIAEQISLQGEQVLVIPELAYWFLRHRSALGSIKSLLSALSITDRPCVVGCNSWTWQFLRRAVDADHYLPHPLTFQAFDSQRLRLWFGQMAKESETVDVRFRESKTGKDVLALDSESEFLSDYLQTLAAYSLGIPWVAWQIWRRSLRTVPKEKAEAELVSNSAKDDVDTMWLVDYREFTLASEDQDLALLILHALLIHDMMTPEQLELIVPIENVSAKVHLLLDQGFIDEADGNLFCASAAYPAIRTYLTNAGFPVDTL